jgi:group I intron endonuclease
MANFNKAKKYHFIYKTACLINDKYYIGMHSTNELNDGYIGSGKRLRRAVCKHGKENFKCEILEFLPNREALAVREKELVNKETLKDLNCMNLSLGGIGGKTYDDYEIRSAAGRKSMTTLNERRKTDPTYKLKCAIASKKNLQKALEVSPRFTGKCHSAETKMKMSKSSKGKGLGSLNSQFGTCWITNTITKKSTKIKKVDLKTYLSNNWIIGRNIK